MSYRRSQRNGKIIRYESKQRDVTITKATEEASMDDIYMQLRRDVKRSSIITRLQQKKNGSVAGRRNTDVKRPPDEQLTKAEGLRQLRKIYEREQQTIGEMLQQQQQRLKPSRKEQRSEPAKIKQGLLGEFKYYERMEKPQLIEKLIALEYLTQKLYKRNKFLEQHVVDPQFKLQQERASPSNLLNRTLY